MLKIVRVVVIMVILWWYKSTIRNVSCWMLEPFKSPPTQGLFQPTRDGLNNTATLICGTQNLWDVLGSFIPHIVTLLVLLFVVWLWGK